MHPPAIRQSYTARDGTEVTIRAMEPTDRDREQAFIHNLSSQSKRFRFFTAIKDLSPRMLDRLTHVDYPRELALVATIGRDDAEQQIGVARYAPGSTADCVEFAVVVADEWHGRGIGGNLLHCLFAEAEKAGATEMEGFVLRTNSEMLQLAKELGFDVSQYPGDAKVVQVRRRL